jgi:DNA replication protein DnaC
MTEQTIEQLLKTLRMPHARAEARELLATAKAQRWEPAEALRVLLEAEVAGRASSMLTIRRKKAGFPTGKTLESWDESLSSIPVATQSFLGTLEWVHRHENLVLCGPSGTGKSMFIEALGSKAVENNMKVLWLTLETLGELINSHRIDSSINKAIARIMASDLICIDDVGLLPVPESAAEGLYRVVDAAYERRSIAISSNLHPAGFDQLMHKTLATATVDRLLHHAHIHQTSGESVRLTQAQSGKGVIAMN